MKQLIMHTGLRWLWLSLIVLIIDLYSKHLVLKYLSLGSTRALLPLLNIHYVRNYGAAFSFLATSSGWQHGFFINIAIVICVLFLVLMYRSYATQTLKSISYALIIGGAWGNLLDRILHGFVIDMIDLYIGIWHFATFNVADCAICIGVILMLFEKNKIVQ
ncbi:signal peptidase II [Candidatus Profftia sp. (ex Adelges kitamiensis)]|uniref:signal peptidase II n=1 Tax=Candidatus Profftia sp. (ex Adelges kitamiensis) TaxID=2864218 RepID=UPI001CE36C9E|nr:signal peptidase II [Candidatus Profftia sp. (ex Adelges kitamiensis)]